MAKLEMAKAEMAKAEMAKAEMAKAEMAKAEMAKAEMAKEVKDLTPRSWMMLIELKAHLTSSWTNEEVPDAMMKN